MRNLSSAGRDLVIVKRRKNVLWIAPIDAIAVAIKHEDVNEMRPGIDRVVGTESAGASDDFLTRCNFAFDPDFVGINGALREGMAEFYGAKNGFEQIFLSRFEGGNIRTQRRNQRLVDAAAFLDAEDVHANRASQEFGVAFDDIGLVAQGGDAGVGGGEKVIVHFADVVGVENLRAEIVLRDLQRHVAAVAVELRDGRIIKAARIVARDAAQEVSVVMILAAQEFLIVIEFVWDADFVAGGAGIGGLVQRLQKSLFVELRLGLDHRFVEEGEEFVRAEGEWVMDRLFDGVIGVAARAVDVRDRVARGASDPGLRGGMIHVVEIRIVESATEKRNDIVTTGAPAGGFDVAIALEGDLARFANAEEIRLVVE